MNANTLCYYQRTVISLTLSYGTLITKRYSGIASTTNALKQSYFIPQILNKVKRTLKNCATCNRVNAQSYKMPTTAALPTFRVNSSVPAFHATDMDYTGEVSVNGDSGIKKVCIVLFTCATTRGVHIDYVQDLTPKQFISCFQRFSAWKSTPRPIISDNGSYFQAASSMDELFSHPSVNEYMNEHGIKSTFIPKRGPWYGAFWERLIGMIKRPLHKICRKAVVTDSELYTLLTLRPISMTDL